ncbi:MAG: class I SAM-dependent methyltransferase [Bacteroidota bacterium]
MNDIHGGAILDYYKQGSADDLILHNSYGEPEEMPVEVFFRDQLDFSTLEHLALIECEGEILDLGAGAGAHALLLQEWGKGVTALDNSPGCCEVMRLSGVENVVETNYLRHQGQYDTLLMLMNGIGIVGKLADLPGFFDYVRTILKPNGQLLVDSSDIGYLYDGDIPKPTGYFGEVNYAYQYKGTKGNWFPWLYVDPDQLVKTCKASGLDAELLLTDENDQYLMRISGF